MCGIAGIFHTDLATTASVGSVAGMVRLVRHRGPDASGVKAYGPVALGHARLSILDLSEDGAQPMEGPSGCAISYNGECYNYRELRSALEGRGVRFRSNSDTEVVLAQYEAQGTEFVRSLRGMFALAIWDERRKRLVLCRDRLGIKPLFYHFDGATLSFASEVKALLTLPNVAFDPDAAWLGSYFSMLSAPGPDSVIRRVKRLLPGQMLLAGPDGVSLRTYWDINDLPEGAGAPPGGEAAELRARLEESVAAHLVSDAPLGVALSGGCDSGLVCKLASFHAGRGLNAYTTTFPAHAEFDESGLTRENARHAGARLWETELTIPSEEDMRAIAWHLDEPLAVSSAIGVYALSRRAREDVKVLLTGDGADELFAGYLFRHARPLPGDTDPARAFADTLRYYGENDLGRFLDKAFVSDIQRDWWLHAAACLRPAKGTPSLGDRLRAEMKATLESEMLTKVDRMTMAWGVEARVPFLDHRFVEWAVGLGDEFKIRDGAAKWVLKKAAADLLPESVLAGRKKGFNVPFHRWLADETFRSLFAAVVVEGHYASQGLFSKKGILEYLRDYDAGRASLEQGHLAFALLELELWHQTVSKASGLGGQAREEM